MRVPIYKMRLEFYLKDGEQIITEKALKGDVDQWNAQQMETLNKSKFIRVVDQFVNTSEIKRVKIIHVSTEFQHD